MNIRLPHSHFDPNHLSLVKKQMLTLGAPVIKAINCGEYYVALEGSHRIRAAKELGLVPIIDEVDFDEDAMTDDIIPVQYQDNLTLREIVDSSYRSIQIDFDD